MIAKNKYISETLVSLHFLKRECKRRVGNLAARGRIRVHSKVANFATPMLGDRRTYDFRKPIANKSQLCEFT